MKIENANKYLNIVKWLQRRYTVNGVLGISVGGNLSTFKKLELEFFNKYNV